jgi:hypothetical protein
LNIPAYNGGLFTADPALDALQVPDKVCAHFKDPSDYDYRPAREVAEGDEDTEVRSVIDVDILGHIFEQSITDLERLCLSLQAGGGGRTFLSAASASGPTAADKNVRAPQKEGLPTTRRKQESKYSSKRSSRRCNWPTSWDTMPTRCAGRCGRRC